MSFVLFVFVFFVCLFFVLFVDWRCRQSRCTKFRFAPLDNDLIRARVRTVADLERIDLTDDGMDALLALAKGDMRKVFNTLQSVHRAHGGQVTADNVHACSGTPSPANVETALTHLLNSPFDETHAAITSVPCANKRLVAGRNGTDMRDVDLVCSVGRCWSNVA